MIKTIAQEEIAVREKITLLKKVRDGTLQTHELAALIAQRRISWLEQNRSLWLGKDLSLEGAYKLLVFQHMEVKDGITMQMKGNTLAVESKNFCPYLEACLALNLDTRKICREIGEPPLNAFFKRINPRFRFYRDYSRIRPYHYCCAGFLEEEQNVA